jgi:pilus assembly protein CpaB
MSRRIAAIAAASLTALLGAVLVFVYAQGADDRAVAAQRPERVYVASQLVPSGTVLKDALRQELVTETTVAAKGVPAGALQEVTPANGNLLALSDIPAGTFLLGSAFGETPTGERAIAVPAGMLAVSVELSDPGRVGTFVTPGSRIAIFSSYKVKRVDDSKEAKAFNEADVHGTSVLLDNVLVIGMGESSLTPTQTNDAEAQDGQEQAAQNNETLKFLVTVAVTPEQATRLVHAVNNYEMYAGLRGSDVKMAPGLRTDDLTINGR